MRIWIVSLAALVATIGIGVGVWRFVPGDEPSPPPIRVSPEQRLVEATFPPKLPLGKRWTLEVEADWPTLRGTWLPQSVHSEFSIAEVSGDVTMVDARDLLFSQLHVRFVLRASTLSVARLQDRGTLAPSLEADNYWTDVKGDVLPVCWFYIYPWHLPIVHRETPVGEILDVLGERYFGEVRQRGWVEDGLIRFEIQPSGTPGAVLSITWRPGDPWWAKYECFVPGKRDNPLPPRRDGGYGRPGRARLVAVDGVPVEPLPWEHPPADWMEGGPPL